MIISIGAEVLKIPVPIYDKMYRRLEHDRASLAF
jgi:hypothetical protein